MLKWIAIIGVVWFLYVVREVFPPFIVGGIIAYLLLPLVNAVSSTLRIRRQFAIAIIYVGFFVILIGTSKIFGGSVVEQASKLVADRHEIMKNLIDQLTTRFSWDMDVTETSVSIVSELENWLGKPNEILHIGELLSKSLLSVLVCTVSSIYFIIDSERVGQFFLRFVPDDKRAPVVELSGKLNVMLAKYIRTQIILVILMSGVAYVILHFFFHIKYALLIAILSGILEIIPILGPLFAISMAVVVGVAQQGLEVGLAIAACYWVARLIEDYAVIPRFVGHVIALHPLAIIFAVICGEVLAGALGMLIAIPCAAAVKEILDFLYPPPDAIHDGRDKDSPAAAALAVEERQKGKTSETEFTSKRIEERTKEEEIERVKNQLDSQDAADENGSTPSKEENADSVSLKTTKMDKEGIKDS